MPLDLDVLAIDPQASARKYAQLADQLRGLIEDGTLGPGESLPGEQVLADHLGIARESVREGLKVLMEEGLLIRQHGKPTRVAEPAPVRILSAGRYVDEVAILRLGGEHPLTSAFVLEHDIDWTSYSVEMATRKAPATARDSELLGVRKGTMILRRHLVKLIDGVPVQLQTSAMRWSVAGGTAVADPQRQPWPGGTIAELWWLGLRDLTTVTEDVSARMPRGDERDQLHMQTPGPVFDVVRVFKATDGQPVEASRVILDASRYRLRFISDLTPAG